jgi:hypothetical protein
MDGGIAMNGTAMNYVRHAALGASLAFVCALLGFPWVGGIVATVYFWAKEIGEKCVQRPAPRQPWSDINPFDPRWSTDNRLDFVSGAVGGWAMAFIWSFI